jgi:hypothetical protein
MVRTQVDSLAMSNQKELWKLISTFMASVNEKLDSLSQTIKTIQQQQQRIEARIDFVEEKMDEGKGINRSQFQEVIKKVVHKMESNNQALKEELVDLDQKIVTLIEKQPRETKLPLEKLEEPVKVSLPQSSSSPRSKPVATPTSISNSAPSSPSSSSYSSPPSPVKRPSPSRALGTLSSLTQSSKPEKTKDLEEIEKITDEDKKLQAALKMFKDM